MLTAKQDKILIVDDERPMRRLLEQILVEYGYSCQDAADAQEAKTRLQQMRFNLVLSDIRMPGETGLELCRYVKSALPDVAFILITAVDDIKTAHEAISMDIYGYIIKPITSTQLLISVANALRRQKLEARERQHREALEKTVREKTADLMRVNEELKKNEMELKELNTALSVLIRKMEEEKEATEERFVENMTKCVLPYMEKLRSSRLSEGQQIDLEIAEINIRKVLSPFINKISSPFLNLTHAEIQVANFIRQGLSTKEIADTMNLSTNTIMTHRAHIRAKLDLKSKKETLYSHLTSLE